MMNLLDFFRLWQVLVLILRDGSISWDLEAYEAPSQQYEELETWCPQSDHTTDTCHGTRRHVRHVRHNTIPVGTALGYECNATP